MIGKISCVLLLLSAYCAAKDADSVDVQEDINAARNKVKSMSENSVQNVVEVTEKLAEITNYFNSSMPKYLVEGETISNSTQLSLYNLTNKFVGEAIDKNRPVSTFKCILKVNGETQNQINDNCESTENCIYGVFNRNNVELTSLRTQLTFIQRATTGLYDTILEKLPSCTTSGAVRELVQQAEVRENNLNKLIRVYLERGSDLRVQFNEGQLACLRSAKGFAENLMKICINKMKAC